MDDWNCGEAASVTSTVSAPVVSSPLSADVVSDAASVAAWVVSVVDEFEPQAVSRLSAMAADVTTAKNFFILFLPLSYIP